MDWSELFTLRRILTATLASLLAATGSGGIIGLAQASDEPAAEGVLEIPLPRMGDSAAYVHEVFEAGEAVQGPIEVLAFTWGPTETFYDAEGQARLVNKLDLRERYSDVEREQTYVVAGGSLQVLATLDSEQRDEPFAGLPGGSSSTTTNVNVWFGSGWELPCLARNPLQGRTLDLAQSFPEPEGCDGLYPSQDYQAVATDGQGRYLFEALRGRDAKTSLLLEEGNPYPLQAAVQEGERLQTWTLHGLRSGDESIATSDFDFQAPPAGVPRSSSIDGPVLMWDGDLQNRHPFTLSQAYTAALQEPAVQLWANDHPDHYVGYAGYVAYVQQGVPEPFWQMDWTDGVDFLQVRIRRPAADNVPLDGPNALLFDVSYTTGSWEERPYWEGTYVYTTPDKLPREMPTASSVLGIWEHHTDDVDSAGVGWSYYVGCRVDEPCEQAEAIVWAGRTASHVRQDGAETTLTRWEIDTLRWQDGQLSSRWDSTQDHRRSFNAPATQPTQTVGAGVQAFQAVPESELRPIEIAAAAAGIGILAGLLVWLWPFMKHAGLIMFTRVRQDRILDHPVRSQLMAAISAEPGMHHQELVRVAGVGKGATEQHLRKLKGAGLVSVSGGKGYTCYFPKGAVDRRVMEAAPVLKAKAARAIVNYINGRPGARAAEIRTALGISASTLHYHMKRLEAVGVIEVRKAGNGNVLDLTHTGRMVAAS